MVHIDDYVSIMQHYGGIDSYVGLEFLAFFQPQRQGVNLHAHADYLIFRNISYSRSHLETIEIKMFISRPILRVLVLRSIPRLGN